MNTIIYQKGQRVWWNDPAGETSDYYTIASDVQQDIEELRKDGGDEHTIPSDLVILLVHDTGGEAEVLVGELEPVYEGTRRELVERESSLRQDMRCFILHHIRRNGGRISLKLPQKDEDWENFEFPVTSVLYGRHFNDSIDITEVYIEPGCSTIYADGQLNGHGDMQRGYEIYPEHYSDILWFITPVLDLK